MQRRVGAPRRVVVGGVEIGLKRLGHGGDVGVVAPRRRGAGDHRLDQRTRIEDVLELGPVGDDLAAHMLGRRRAPVGAHEIAAIAAAPHLEIAGVGQLLQRLADRGARDAEHRREFALGRQLLAGDIEAERHRSDQPVDDVVGDVTRNDRRAPMVGSGRLRRIGLGRLGGWWHLVEGGHAPSPWPKRIRMKRASVRAASTMLWSSTDSSMPCMLWAIGP